MISAVVIILMFILGFSLKKGFAKVSPWDSKNLNLLWVYHFAVGIGFALYIKYGPGGDAFGYWNNPRRMNFSELMMAFDSHGIGTYSVYLINFFPIHYLDLSFFALASIYILIGYWGMVFFYFFFKRNIPANTKLFGYYLFPLLFFLPNFNWWSSGIGKDTLLFFCIALFFYGMQKPSKYWFKLIFALALSYFIRPHITIFLSAAFGMGFMLDGNLKTYQKVLFVGIFIVGFALTFDNLMNYLQLDDTSSENIENFANNKVDKLNEENTGSGVDISSYPLPLKMFTFLYRPLVFDARGILGLVASAENLLLLILSVKFFRNKPLKVFRESSYLFKSLLFFLTIGTLGFSLILSNMGIMLRQKNMFLPALFFIIMYSLSTKKVKI